MHKTLMAHDLTGRSAIALLRAARLTLEREGCLTILHVIDADQPAALVEAQRVRAQAHLDVEVRHWLRPDSPPHRIEIAVGDPAAAIAAHAQEQGADLVVAGRHRPRRFADAFIGTTVERLLRQIEQPVLVVAKSDQSPYRKVLIPIDFSDASVVAVRFAAAFLPQAILHLVHARKRSLRDFVPALPLTLSRDVNAEVTDPNYRQARLAMSQLIETLGLGARRPIVTIAVGNAAALIDKEHALRKSDLLVMGTHARSGLAYALVGSPTEAILRSNRCDMVIVPVCA